MKQEGTRVLTTLGMGLALGQILVWILETFYLVDPIPAQIAIAFGNVMAGALHVAVLGVRHFFQGGKNDVQ